MIESFIVIVLFLIQLHSFASSISTTKSDFDCIEIPRNSMMSRDNYLGPRMGMSPPQEEFIFVNISLQRFNAPCFNTTFPTSLTAEEGNDVVLPCVVHNVDFNSIVVCIFLLSCFHSTSTSVNFSISLVFRFDFK